MDKKVNDDLIVGLESIEGILRKDFLLLWDWKRDFQFPLSKFLGRPCISRKALREWLTEYADGNPLETLTTEMLDKMHDRRQLESMEGEEITGFDNICRFVRYQQDVVLRWSRETGSPMRIPSGGEVRDLSVNSRDLLLWMSEMGIGKGTYDYPPSIKILPLEVF